MVTSVVGFLTVFVLVGTRVQGAQDIGSLFQCAHDLRGRVWVVNDREIMIQGFNYDGKGPAAWFHGQLRPAQAISTSDPDKYETLPYPNDNCERLTKGRAYKDENVTLILPRSIKDFQTIGVFCYEYCHNFGHVIIPENINVPSAPPNHLAVSGCSKPTYTTCKNPKNAALEPDCKAGASSTQMQLPKSGFIFLWFILSFLLTFHSWE